MLLACVTCGAQDRSPNSDPAQRVSSAKTEQSWPTSRPLEARKEPVKTAKRIRAPAASVVCGRKNCYALFGVFLT